MYTVSKAPSKLVAKTRRGGGYDQQFRELGKKGGPEYSDLSSPRPVFHQTTSRRFATLKTQQFHHQEETISPQHEEIIKYIHESWNMVMADQYESPSSPDSAISMSSSSTKTNLSSFSNASLSTNASSSSSISGATYYVGSSSPQLNEFKPFDLEVFWGRRLYNSITKSL